MGWLTEQGADFLEQAAAQQVAMFEESLVRRILKRAGCCPSVAALRAAARAATNELNVSFTWFHQAYPMFPVALGAAKLKWMHEVKVGQLFGGEFMKLPPVAAYQKFCESTDADPRTSRCGLIFNWPGIGAGGNAMVLHNYPVETLPNDPDVRRERGTRIVRPYGQPLVVYVIEALDDFLDSVGTAWAAG